MIMGTLSHGEKISVLTEILKPEGIEVADGRLYVVQGPEFFVYNLNNSTLIKEFGKAGEGPGELSTVLNFPNSLRVLDDKIIAEGFNKIIIFSKDFNFLKEFRKKEMLIHKITPIKENFLAVRMSAGKNKIIFTLLLLDPDMNTIKELHKQESFDRQKELIMVRDTIHFEVYNDKIYVEESDKGFFIEIFDSSGNRLYEIKKNFDAPKVTENDKKAIFNNLKMDNLIAVVARREGGWDEFAKKGTFTYPAAFPHIQDIKIVNDKIYVSTFEHKDNKEKCMIMDLKGNIIGSSYLPVTGESSFLARSMGKDNRFYGISNNKFYYLKENEDEEVWELHAVRF
jgi:hypothetical protein